MAKTPNKNWKLVVYLKQLPDSSDKATTPYEKVTPHLGHEYRLGPKFSEEVEVEEQVVPGRPHGARETFAKRFRVTRSKHMPHPAPIKGGEYRQTSQMEKPHYEEYEMQESSMTVWKHKTKDVSVDWNKHGHKFTVHVKGERVSGHHTQDSAVAAANRRAKQMDDRIEEARERSPDYLGTVHRDDPDYDKKIGEFKKGHKLRIRGRLGKDNPNAPLYRQGGKHYRSSSLDIKPEHSKSVDVYTRGERKKTMKEAVEMFTEAAKRGRPRKLRPGEEADTLHIQDQLNKLTHPNHVDVHFKDGTKHQIPREHANKALQHLASLKPIEREAHAEHMGKGHSEFYHVLTRKSIPDKKPKITLAGPKLRKEEADHDDGWYAHKEMHGSEAVSKEDWKKGVRLNRDGKRVQMKKKEAELEEQKAPRKGSLKDLMAKQSKKYWDSTPDYEIKDDKVGNAKVKREVK